MSIINLLGVDDLFAPPDANVFLVKGPRHDMPEEYKILKPFNPQEVEMSLTHRGQRPTAETLVEFLIMQGFIKPLRVQ
jgi:glutamate/tyrosine decarboxylase-like PLP-dependent enzyme